MRAPEVTRQRRNYSRFATCSRRITFYRISNDEKIGRFCDVTKIMKEKVGCPSCGTGVQAGRGMQEGNWKDRNRFASRNQL